MTLLTIQGLVPVEEIKSLQSEPPIPITIERAHSTISLPQNILLSSETYTSNDESIGEYESSLSNCIQSHACNI